MNSDYHNADATSTRRVNGHCSRMRAEFLQDPLEVVETNGNVIDIQRSFAPQPFFFILFIKVVLTVIFFDTIIRDFLYSDDAARSFYLAYLTHWGLVIAEGYNLISLACTIMPHPEQPNNGAPVSLLIRMAWIGFSLTATVQVLIVVLFWGGVYVAGYSGNVGYLGFMQHGGIMVLVLLEGLVVNRVPVRICHLRYPMVLLFLYAVWSVIHDLFTDIGNPNVNDQPGDDDAIYEEMNWKKRPGLTAALFVFSVFVVAPTLFFIIYFWSLPWRRYVVHQPSIGVPKKGLKRNIKHNFAAV